MAEKLSPPHHAAGLARRAPPRVRPLVLFFLKDPNMVLSSIGEV